MRTIVFKLKTGPAEQDFIDAEIDVDDTETEEEINEMFHDWVWEHLNCTWYEK